MAKKKAWAPVSKPRGRPRKEMSKTVAMDKPPENRVLTPSNPSGSPESTISRPIVTDTNYPKALYHKTKSKPGNLVSKLVASAEEEKAAGDNWVPHSELELDDEEESE